MRALQKIIIMMIVVCGYGSVNQLSANEWRGNIAVEGRWFYHDPIDTQQHGNNVALSAQPEFYHEWRNGEQSITITPFFRLDQNDSERTHVDIRELFWLKVARDWELRVGIGQVFWGVTESQHLVDVINQTDAIENADGEDKLGQPMVNFTWIQDWGIWDFFVLPGFRERTFPGKKGRLRFQPYVDTNNAKYESSAKEKQVDFALRWTHTLADWDIGLSHFYGTSREPRVVPNADRSALIPVYNLMNQSGLDLQTTIGDWLWKLEVISRKPSKNRRIMALTGGFEYTLVGILETSMDLGIISEYLYDDRDAQATTPFANDLMLGGRLVVNDVQSTEMLVGIIFDLDTDAKLYTLEANRRLGDAWKLTVEARLFTELSRSNLLFDLRNDDMIQAELAWFF